VEKAGMSSSAGVRSNQASQRGMTLIEMLCVIGIIALLAAMLLPALQRGKSKAQQIRCVSNLRQVGLASLSFAHSHEDKFPVQVSTNQGGSLEYLQAASALSGEFYFSYRHFLPLATELDTPKVLRCPADVRSEATNFASLRNENLSYFVGANPVYGRSDSALSGDRNLSPLYGTMVRVGGVVNLKWTEEMHQHRGNVLFADGHVEQRKDLFNPVESTNGTMTTIVMPTVKTVTPGGATGGQPGGGGGAPGGTLAFAPSSPGVASVHNPNSNAPPLTNITSTNLSITATPRNANHGTIISSTPVGGGGDISPTPIGQPPPAPPTNRTYGKLASPDSAVTVEPKLEAPSQSEPGKAAKPNTTAPRSSNLWWLVLLLLALLVIVWLLSRRSKRENDAADVEQSSQIEDAGNTEQPKRTPIP
jgi:prepilin-type N-terminal cleavage/methylation domain-containing protein/prepilin-type processing-associated H-X9-DG protein